jgi:hypothetical protein
MLGCSLQLLLLDVLDLYSKKRAAHKGGGGGGGFLPHKKLHTELITVLHQ